MRMKWSNGPTAASLQHHPVAPRRTSPVSRHSGLHSTNPVAIEWHARATRLLEARITDSGPRRSCCRRLFAALAAGMVTTWCSAGSAARSAEELLPDSQVVERLEHIQSALDDGETYAQIWQWGWLGFHAVSVAAGAALAAIEWRDETSRAGMLGLAGKSVLSLGLALFVPLEAASAPGILRRMPDSTQEQRRRKLAKAEQLLADCARDAERKTSWLPHILNLGVNATAAVITYLYLNAQRDGSDAHDERFTTPLLGFALGFGAITAKIFMTSTRTEDDWRAYQSKLHGLPPEPIVSWFVAPGPGGLLAGAQF